MVDVLFLVHVAIGAVSLVRDPDAFLVGPHFLGVIASQSRVEAPDIVWPHFGFKLTFTCEIHL